MIATRSTYLTSREQITSGSLFFVTDSPDVGNAKLYAPATYLGGSQIYHLDNDTYYRTPNALQTPFTECVPTSCL